MSYPYFADVQRAYDDLRAEGLIQPRATQDEVEQDKGLLCRRAAWYTHSGQNRAIGLLEKTSGNNSLGYSVDWNVDLLLAVGYDVATDQEAADGMREAVPVNGGPSEPSQDNRERWRPPTAELAQMPDEPTPEPEPEPPADTEAILQAIADSEARIVAHVTSETDRVMQRLADYRQEVIDFAEIAGKIIAAVWLARRQE
jgi:hypothetical protein